MLFPRLGLDNTTYRETFRENISACLLATQFFQRLRWCLIWYYCSKYQCEQPSAGSIPPATRPHDREIQDRVLPTPEVTPVVYSTTTFKTKCNIRAVDWTPVPQAAPIRLRSQTRMTMNVLAPASILWCPAYACHQQLPAPRDRLCRRPHGP